jgi:hypothetical protein
MRVGQVETERFDVIQTLVDVHPGWTMLALEVTVKNMTDYELSRFKSVLRIITY